MTALPNKHQNEHHMVTKKQTKEHLVKNLLKEGFKYSREKRRQQKIKLQHRTEISGEKWHAAHV